MYNSQYQSDAIANAVKGCSLDYSCTGLPFICEKRIAHRVNFSIRSEAAWVFLTFLTFNGETYDRAEVSVPSVMAFNILARMDYDFQKWAAEIYEIYRDLPF